MRFAQGDQIGTQGGPQSTPTRTCTTSNNTTFPHTARAQQKFGTTCAGRPEPGSQTAQTNHAAGPCPGVPANPTPDPRQNHPLRRAVFDALRPAGKQSHRDPWPDHPRYRPAPVAEMNLRSAGVHSLSGPYLALRQPQGPAGDRPATDCYCAPGQPATQCTQAARRPLLNRLNRFSKPGRIRKLRRCSFAPQTARACPGRSATGSLAPQSQTGGFSPAPELWPPPRPANGAPQSGPYLRVHRPVLGLFCRLQRAKRTPWCRGLSERFPPKPVGLGFSPPAERQSFGGPAGVTHPRLPDRA